MEIILHILHMRHLVSLIFGIFFFSAIYKAIKITKYFLLEVYMRYYVCYLMVLCLIFIGCSDDKSTQSEQADDQSSFYLNRLVVSMVPGASETVKIVATDFDWSAGEFEVDNQSPSIASVTLTDSLIEITGLSYGIDTLRITSDGETYAILPVQVYNHRVIDTGEFLITYTDEFEFIYSYAMNPGWDIYFYRPVPPEGFYALGSYARDGEDDPNGNAAVMVVQPKTDSDAVTFTTEFTDYNTYIHNPVAPSGYKAMGQVITAASQTPEPTACLREDLTVSGECYLFWADYDSYGNYNSCWYIRQPSTGFHANAYLQQGTFIFKYGMAEPSSPLANVLNISLPTLAEAPSQEYVPSLTGYDVPTDGLAPKMEKCLLVPYRIIVDSDQDGSWKIANSPFYRLERQVFYKYINHYDNSQGSMSQSFHWEISYGMTTTQSETVWGETGVELSVEAGVSIYSVSTRVTATVSESFGYESMTSISELESNTLTIDVNVPAHKAAALWQRYNRFVLYRHNGTDLEEVSSWQCGINSYVMDEYPD